MSTLLSRPRLGRGKQAGVTTLQVYTDGELLGAVLLGQAGRVLHCTPDIPSEVVFHIVVAFTRRDEVRGEIHWRKGGTYIWHMDGEEI